MKITWEPTDIKVGKFVYKPRQNGSHIDGWDAKWTYQIGYCGGSGQNLVLISLADGMVGKTKTAEEICNYFNAENIHPVPLLKLNKIIEFIHSCHTL